MKIIEAIDLAKRYSGFVALERVNLEVAEGEIFGLLGPNGAGKTTMIRILTGQAKPSAGQARIAGLDIAHDMVKVKRHIGYVPEVSNLYDEMSAWDNLIFASELYGVPRSEREKRAKELLELVGLLDRRNDKVSTFSKGMKRRLTIVAALIHKPDLLILDEPTSGLDVQSALTIRNFIKELNKDATVFMTTHYIEEADQLCSRIAIIQNGRIIAVDRPEALKTSIMEQQVIEVSFSPSGDLEDKLVCLANVIRVSKGGDKFKLYVEDASKVFPLLIDFASENDLRILSLNTLKPSLEDAFVKITGISPNLMASEKELGKRSADVG